MNPIVILRLFETTEFQVGLVAGLLALAVGLALRRRGPHVSLLFSFAAVAALGWLDLFSIAATERSALRAWWILPTAVLAIVCSVYAAKQRMGGAHPALAIAITVGGVWATVPDTEEAAVLVGAMSALFVLTWLPRRGRLALVGAEFASLIVAWVVVVGSVGRDGAVIGGLGALASLGLLRLILVRRPWWDIGLHLILVLVWTRVAGLRQSAVEAAALGLFATAVIAAVRWQIAPYSSTLPKRQTVVSVVEHSPKTDRADDHGDGGDDDARARERHKQDR